MVISSIPGFVILCQTLQILVNIYAKLIYSFTAVRDEFKVRAVCSCDNWIPNALSGEIMAEYLAPCLVRQ